jgi:hypothetical protein
MKRKRTRRENGYTTWAEGVATLRQIADDLEQRNYPHNKTAELVKVYVNMWYAADDEKEATNQ